MTKRAYKNQLNKATTINELVWIESNIKQDMSLDCDNLLGLLRHSDSLKDSMEKAGDKYTRATKPAWM